MTKHTAKPTLIIAVGVLVGCVALWYFAPWAGAVVRPLAGHSTYACGLSPSGVAVFHSEAELREACSGGRFEPAGEVDFERDNLVRVAWESSGVLRDADRRAGGGEPRAVEYGRLAYRVRQGGAEVLFYVNEPGGWGAFRQVFSKLHDEQWFSRAQARARRLGQLEGLVDDGCRYWRSARRDVGYHGPSGAGPARTATVVPATIDHRRERGRCRFKRFRL